MAVDDAFTKALLHFNGADASTTFTDESTKIWTPAGNAQIDTAQSKFGGASGLFDGTGDKITTPHHDDLCNLGTGDWTVDFWVRFSAINRDQGFCGVRVDGSNVWRVRFEDSPKLVRFDAVRGGSTIAGYDWAWTPSADTWYHFEMSRNTSTMRLFIGGTLVTIDTTRTAISTNDLTDLNADFQVAHEPSGAEPYLAGWMDEFRFSKGIARHTANFSPPTQPYGLLTGAAFLENFM